MIEPQVSGTTEAPCRTTRTYLYVPGDNFERLTGAESRGADAVIADLEDSVALNRKALALSSVTAWLAESTPRPTTERWVRVNADRQGIQEIRALFGHGLTGFCLPKVTSQSDVLRVAQILTDLESVDSCHEQTLLMPLIESAAALEALAGIASENRVHLLQLGELDLAAELALRPGKDEAELAPLRSRVVVASAAAGLLPPVGPVSPLYRDLDSFAESTERLKRAGFLGRAVIHPAQIAVVHRVFAVSAEEAHRARKVVDRYQRAQEEGTGVLVGDDGRMVDEAVVRHYRLTVALAAAADRQGSRQ